MSNNPFERDLPELNMAQGTYGHSGGFTDVHAACTKWLEKRGLSERFFSFGHVSRSTGEAARKGLREENAERPTSNAEGRTERRAA